ncbi:MAG: saccharopine dehydrogenase [Chloroflexi bacterium]|nr:MAG: saccharopine dehydrogenase [Chloroflexota bacterium]
MIEKEWMLYGAYGYTGRLIAVEAVRRGHKPVLAGRSAKKLEPFARQLGLDWKAFSLEDAGLLVENIRGSRLVLHAAGPFTYTSDPMIRACLESGAHYVDITGELNVFENTFSYHSSAIDRGVLLLSGAGIDVIPSDCLIKVVVDKLPDAIELESAVAAVGQASVGTKRSGLEIIASGGWVRRNGRLVPVPFAKGARDIVFSDHPRTVIPFPWGDLSTAYRSTGIPNITTYVAVPHRLANILNAFGPMLPKLLKPRFVRKTLDVIFENFQQEPDENQLNRKTSHFWARAAAPDGMEVLGWLETIEGYQFTAKASVRVVERILAENPKGALSPAQAFGSDLVMEIKGTNMEVTPPSRRNSPG